MDFLTAKKGEPHFTSEQFRTMLTAICGTDTYISQIYNQLSAEVITNNIIRINSGMLIHHGGLFLIDEGSYDEVNCQNGSQGMRRIDLIVARYTKDASTGIENAEWVVLRGEEATENPTAPKHSQGNMQNGDLVDDCPVFEVLYDGLNIISITTLQTVTKSIAGLEKLYTQLFQSVSDGKTLIASAITDKGITTDANARFETMAENIALIMPGVSGSGNVNGIISHMEEAYYEADSLGANWTGTLTNNAVNLAADGTYIVVLAYSQSINANYAGVNFDCEWKDLQFPAGSEAALLYENGLDGISLFRVYKVTTGATAGAITATVQLSGHYNKKAALEVCVLN